MGTASPTSWRTARSAAQRGFAFAGTFADPDWPPYILSAVFSQDHDSVQAQFDLQASKSISSTWALLYLPLL